jgi:multiple sugar transport system permease protein
MGTLSQRAALPSQRSSADWFRSLRAGPILAYVPLGLWSLVCLFPLYWIAATTLKQPLDVINGPRYLPFVDFKPTLDAWSYILFNPDDDTLRRYLNSIIVSVGATALSVTFGAFAAYGLTRLRASFSVATIAVFVIAAGGATVISLVGANTLTAAAAAVLLIVVAGIPIRWRRRANRRVVTNTGIFLAILATRILPPVVTVLPIYLLFERTHLLDTRFALILTYTAANLPIAIWLARAFFDEVPPEIEEAAALDGASAFRTFSAVVLPMAKAGIVATALLVFVLCWNEYLFAVYLTSDHALTMPPFLTGQMATREQMASADPEWGYFSVLIVLMVAPLVLVAGVVQRVVSRGVRG